MRLPHAVPLARIIASALLSVTALVAQEHPLPDQERFLRDVRTRLQTDSTLQSGYIYVETRREQKVDGRGQVEQESVKVYESYPGLPARIGGSGSSRRTDGPGLRPTWRRSCATVRRSSSSTTSAWSAANCSLR